MGEALIRVKDLCKIYNPGENEVRALDHINLEIDKGEFVAIMGQSGSGKSTLMNIIGALDRPTEGTYTLDGVPMADVPDDMLSEIRNLKIGFVFQKFYLIPEFTVWENIFIPFYLDDKNPDMDYVEFLLKEMHMWERKDFFPGELSGGEQQRAAIVRALANRPEILFADEPTGNLDVKNSEEVLALFQKLQRQIGQTVVMVTHDLDIARRADRIICLEDGKIVSDTEEENECES